MTLAGGVLSLKGSAGATNKQTIGTLTFNPGGSAITLVPNGATALSMTTGTTWTHGAAGASANLNLSGGSLNVGTLAATNGLIGGGYVTVNGTDWAAKDANNNIVAYSGYTAGLPSGGSAATNFSGTDSYTLAVSSTANTLKLTTSTTGGALTMTGNSLTIAGGGLLFTGSNAYSITGGSLTAGNGVGTYDLIVQQFASAPLTISSTIANNGANAVNLVVAGSGTTVLAAANAYGGTTFLNGGVLQFSNSSQLGLAGTSSITFGGGALQWSNTTTDITSGRNVTIGSGGATLDTQGNAVTLASPFAANSVGSLTKVGSGTLTITATDANFTGDVYVNAGTLVASSTSALGVGANANVVVNSGATLQLGNNSFSPALLAATGRNLVVSGGTVNNSSGGDTRLGNVWLNGGTIVTQNGLASNGKFYLGPISGGPNATVFVGGTQPSQITTTGNSANDVALGPQTVFNVASTGQPAGTPDLTIAVRMANQYPVSATEPGGMIKTGQGTMKLTGDFNANSSFTGGFVLAQGTVQSDGNIGGTGNIVQVGDALTRPTDNPALLLNATASVLNNAVVVNNYGGTAALGSTSTSGSGYVATFNGPVTLNKAVVLSNSNTNSTSSVVFSGGIMGSGGVNVTGGGRVVIGGTNSYTGGTTISGGTLQLQQAPLPVTSGLVYELSAANGYVLNANGSNVASLPDLSGNGNNFLATGTNPGPTVLSGTNGINGLSVLHFNGAQALTLLNTTTVKQVFIIDRPTVAGGGNDGIWGQNNADDGIRQAGNAWYYGGGNGNDYVGASTGGSMWINGVQVAAGTTARTLPTPRNCWKPNSPLRAHGLPRAWANTLPATPRATTPATWARSWPTAER